jgi:PAS domain S-box-containing protein
MADTKPTYEELEARLVEAEKIIEAIRAEEVDAVIGKDKIYLIRLKEMEKAVHESQEEARERSAEIEAIYNSAPVGLCFLGPDLRYIRVNKRLAHINGIPVTDHIGKTVQEIVPQLAAHAEEIYEQIRQTGQPVFNAEFTGATASDPHLNRHWSEHWFPIKNVNGDLVGINVAVDDITERKEVEEMLQKGRDRLEEKIAERTARLGLVTEQLRELTMQLMVTERNERQRIAGILHDELQQLLVGAKIRLESLYQGLNSDDEQDKLDKSIQLIVDSLKMSRSLTEELAPKAMEHESLAKVFEWVCDFMERTHNLKADLVLDDEIEIHNRDIRLFLGQSVRELLFNVVKHSGVDAARIRLTRDKSGLLQITVSDQGKGFDPSLIHETQPLGTHFGLFSIRQRLSFLEGSMKLESNPGKGTTCTLTMPLERIDPSEIAEESTPSANPPETTRADRGSRIHVLVVDDHEMVRQAFIALLAKERDIKVVGHAGDGAKAIEMALQLIPDVVLMDVNMPETDGIEATRVILSALPEVQIIGLSIDDSKATVEKMFAAGACGFVGKDRVSEDVLAAIRAHGRRHNRIKSVDS